MLKNERDGGGEGGGIVIEVDLKDNGCSSFQSASYRQINQFSFLPLFI
jgi:hypothetical protein